jgi:hypothetical protein
MRMPTKNSQLGPNGIENMGSSNRVTTFLKRYGPKPSLIAIEMPHNLQPDGSGLQPKRPSARNEDSLDLNLRCPEVV